MSETATLAVLTQVWQFGDINVTTRKGQVSTVKISDVDRHRTFGLLQAPDCPLSLMTRLATIDDPAPKEYRLLDPQSLPVLL